MPELPEVETIKNTLEPLIKNKCISKAEVNKPKLVKSDLDSFTNHLVGRKVLFLERIGKYLIIHLDDDLVLVSHLRMEGKYYFMGEDDANSKYAHIIYHFSDNSKLCYDDSRQFGLAILSDEKHYKKLKEIAKLGSEPFDISEKELKEKIAHLNKPIKEALLDQSIISGLGNIYVDEVLFKSKIHPETKAKDIDDEEIKNIIKYSIETLNNAIKDGGSTIRSYHPANGIDGNFQTRLLCYGKANSPCPRCHTALVKISVGGRGTTFCPHCQKNKSLPVIIGITGLIGSGKSTVLDCFKNKGIKTYSCDEIVKTLYQRKDVIKCVNNKMGFSENYIDGLKLLKLVAIDKKKRLELEHIVHPLVKRELIKEIANAKQNIVAIEVPLLFNAHMDTMCDYIIGVNLSYKNEIRHLLIRNEKHLYESLVLASNNAFLKNLDKVDYLINNDGTKEELNVESEQIVNEILSLIKK